LNVIPYNAVAGLPYRVPNRKAQERFLEILREAGINVQVRERKGNAIDAACGQLRRIGAADNPSPPTPLPQGARGDKSAPPLLHGERGEDVVARFADEHAVPLSPPRERG
jgi:hypothetical protein